MSRREKADPGLKPTRYELQVSIGGRWVKIGAWSGYRPSRLSHVDAGEARDAIEWAKDLDAPLGRERLTAAEVESDAMDVAHAAARRRADTDRPT
jgi:hypothetical protein